MAQKYSDLQKIKDLIEIMKDNDLVEVEIKHGDEQIVLKRYQPGPQIISGAVTSLPVAGVGISAVPAAESASDEAKRANSAKQDENLVEVKSPIVGTLYAKPSPDSEPYVEAGSVVSPQTVVCVIEAMKVMNEIKAQTGGTIAEVLVDNGQAVEYGQVLFKIRPE